MKEPKHKDRTVEFADEVSVAIQKRIGKQTRNEADADYHIDRAEEKRQRRAAKRLKDWRP